MPIPLVQIYELEDILSVTEEIEANPFYKGYKYQ